MDDATRDRRAEAEAEREIAEAEESFAAAGLAPAAAEGRARDWHNKHEGLADQLASAEPEVAVPMDSTNRTESTSSTKHQQDEWAISDEAARKADSGQPGGGAGRKEDVHGSGVYPASGPLPQGNAPVVTPAAWGQGDRGPAGYEDHGSSETFAEGSPCCAEDPREEERKAA